MKRKKGPCKKQGPFKFSQRSLTKLKTCHFKLQEVAKEAIKYMNFSVECGHRDEWNQNNVYLLGYSKVKFPKSYHNKQPSMAVDLLPYPTRYKKDEEFFRLAGVVTAVAGIMGIDIEWGYDKWKWDMPHFQLKRGDK